MVEYNRIVVVAVVVVEYLSSSLASTADTLFLSSFLYRRYFVHVKHFVVVGAFVVNKYVLSFISDLCVFESFR